MTVTELIWMENPPRPYLIEKWGNSPLEEESRRIHVAPVELNATATQRQLLCLEITINDVRVIEPAKGALVKSWYGGLLGTMASRQPAFRLGAFTLTSSRGF